ncbi:hypothetical protein EDB83DRAFT_1009131 [Lactarius deliciosus]|nr:hypothetical protein EDB83DRAFT_243953 [Lactarius deliciosus]KAH9058885.1 hypothetical protein EDB83DRAFT_1009131 [Lactarius deliciosus]
MLVVAATIGIRVFINANPVRDKNRFATTTNVFQETTLISSLVYNIFGTGIISLKAWRYRRWIATDLQCVVNKRTKAERVLALLVESGVFSIFSGLFTGNSVQSSLPRIQHRLTTSVTSLPLHSQSDCRSPHQVHAHG